MGNILRVFEHQSVPVLDNPFDDKGVKIGITPGEYEELVRFHSQHNEYFQLSFKRIKFNHYVGVIQIKGLLIEVVPKIDSFNSDLNVWQEALTFMIHTTQKLKANFIGEADMSTQNHHLLDLFFLAYLNEVEALLHHGITKKYHFRDINLSCFRGKLNASRDAIINIGDKTKVNCHVQEFSTSHLYNQTIKSALSVVKLISRQSSIRLHAQKLLLSFVDVKNVMKFSVKQMCNLQVDRKHSYYEQSIRLAKMILQNQSPSLKNGESNSISFMFDMNRLYEDFIYTVLKQGLEKNGLTVSKPRQKFWKDKELRPDILIEGQGKTVIIDTKWKISSAPLDTDLRQIFAYNERFNATAGFLLYPSIDSLFCEPVAYNDKLHKCGIWSISLIGPDGKMSKSAIADQVYNAFVTYV